MRDPELVARAKRAAMRLESSWEHWRALHGLAVSPGQPVVSYVGYSLKEPWGEPRVVIGINADEAESLAAFLDHDEYANGAQIPRQHVRLSEPSPLSASEYTRPTLLSAQVGRGMAPQSPDQVRDLAEELAGWRSGELMGQAPEQLAAWPPSLHAVSDTPPAGV
ncbi:MAG TPA: hypothetical protein VME19_07385 [Streptosporangiaceae bacterium]|nr:hypothetical protein [Streptosporangiaceae bacterium]